MAIRRGRSASGRYGGGWRKFRKAPSRSRKRGGTGSSALEDSLAAQIRLANLPSPLRQVRLIPNRKFLWDFAWKELKLALEVQGGEWKLGAHTSGKGMARDCEKNALAQLEGYRAISVTGSMVRDGRALDLLRRLIGKPCEPKISDA